MSIINVDCVYLASEMNRISISWENLSQYLATFIIIISVFRTLSNMMEFFYQNRERFLSSASLMFFMVLNAPLILIQWLLKRKLPSKFSKFVCLFVWNFFWLFLRTTFKRKVWEVWVHTVRFFNKDLYLDIDPFLLIPWKNLRDAK